MKKNYLALTLGLALLVNPMELQAQGGGNVITNPCERGPLPRVKIINHARYKFAARLREIRPDIPAHVASQIALDVCDDLGMLYDSDALSRRTNQLIREAGY